MAEIPFLSPEDLSSEMNLFHRGERGRRTVNTAFYGRGVRGSVAVTIQNETRDVDIVPVHCELELRQALNDAEKSGRAVALLVDFDQRLPPDLQGRLAHGQLQYISPERRLSNLFGVPRVAPTLVDSPLATALLQAGWPYPATKAATTVDLTTGWRLFLSRAIGLPSDDALTEEGVIVFLANRSPAAADPLLAHLLDAVPGFPGALDDFWSREVGPIARLAWTNWRAGRAADVAAMAFVLDAVVGRLEEGAVKVFVGLRLKEFSPAKGAVSDALVTRWAGLAQALSLRLGERSAEILRRADALVDEAALLDVLRDSRFLTAGFAGMKADLATLLDGAVAAVKPDGTGSVRRADVAKGTALLRRLESHRLAKVIENVATMDRAEMGVRLLAFLSVRPDWEAELKDATLVEPLYHLAESFALEGGFVDQARKFVRGGHHGEVLDGALDRVADAADAVRDQMDRRFARALAVWNEDRRPGRVLPIEDVLSELAVTFLKEGDRRRLLILLMDGMSWASAAEIISDIAERGHSPLRWQPPRALRPGTPIPMIAALPTMTEISRAALFGGKLLTPGEPLSTMRDPERLLQHKGFVKAFGEGPPLMLRTDAETTTGDLTVEARKLVESSARAVGIVVNAVDDQLTSKPGYQVHANCRTIKALEPLLTLALKAQRAVLLIGDHGHVTSSRPHTPIDGAKADNPRYREIDAGLPVSDREISVGGATVYTGRKGRRLAMLYAETDRYVSQRHIGEHGGASLAEVVTPALMIGSQDLRALVGEEGEALDVVAYPIPAWWRLDVPVEKTAPPVTTAPHPPVKSGGKTRSPVNEAQLAFVSVVPAHSKPVTIQSAPVRSLTPSTWALRLGQVFTGLEKPRQLDLENRVVPAIDLLVEHGGRLAEDVFAGHLGEATRNVGGRVALMGEFLNEDGYQVIVHDASGKQVRLDISLLEQLFGG